MVEGKAPGSGGEIESITSSNLLQRRTKESWMDSGVREGEKRVSGSGGKPLVQPSNWHSI